MKPCAPGTTMKAFALSTTGKLLDDVAEAVSRASGSADEEAIHKLRVSIRRFQQSLRLFEQFFGGKALRRVRREVKSVLDPAGELRNYDIGMKLIGQRGPMQQFREKRADAEGLLSEALKSLAADDFAARWRKELEIPA